MKNIVLWLAGIGLSIFISTFIVKNYLFKTKQPNQPRALAPVSNPLDLAIAHREAS